MRKIAARIKMTCIAMLAVTLITGIVSVGTRAASDVMNIVAIDLRGGNAGEATMVSDGNGRSLLIDSGDNKNDAVFDWLNDNGYKNKKFDTLVTHWHDDHAGNTAEIIRRYNVGTVYLPDTSYLNKDTKYYRYEKSYYTDIINAAKKNKTKVVYLKKGQTINVGTVSGKVLYVNGSPQSENWYDVQYINNQSAAIMFTGGGSKFLAAGDLQGQAEKRLLNSGQSVKADIYKMNHHGYDRSNSQSFINAVKPTYAYFTSNTVTQNKYTSADVRDGVTRMGKIANVFSTRFNGTIRFVCSNGEIKVSAGRNVSKMYQRLIDKKTGKSRLRTYVFNNECRVHMTNKILDNSRYYNRQLNADGSVFTGKVVKVGNYYYLKSGNIPAFNTVAVYGGKKYFYDYSGKK